MKQPMWLFSPQTRRISILVFGFAAPLLAFAVLVPLKAYSQGQFPRRSKRTAGATAYTPEVKIEVRDGYRYITANGISNHPTGAFPNRGNPNSISPQEYHFRLPLQPSSTTSTRPSRGKHLESRSMGSSSIPVPPSFGTVIFSGTTRRLPA